MWFNLTEGEGPRRPRSGYRRNNIAEQMIALDEYKDYLKEKEEKSKDKDKHKKHESGGSGGGSVVSLAIFFTVLSPFIGAAQVYALAYAYANLLHVMSALPKP